MIAAARAGSLPALGRELSASAPSLIALGAIAAVVVGLTAQSGAYYPAAWGWAALATSAAGLLLFALPKRGELTRADWLLIVTLAVFTAWTGISALRRGTATLAVPAFERTAFYALIVATTLIACRRAAVSVNALIGGTLSGIVVLCCWGLARLVFPGGAAPDYYEGRLLFQPIGYANGMGAVAAMGAALAVGVSCHARSVAIRAIAAASLVPLAATLWFTSSKGAAAALVFAVVVMVALDPLRRRLLATIAVVAPLPLLGVWLGSRSQLADAHADPATVAQSGHVVAAVLGLLTVCSVLIALSLLQDKRLERIAPVAVFLALVAAAAAGLVIGLKPPQGFLGDRAQYWHAAISDARAHPMLGSGAGSFQASWLRYRTTPVSVLNAHSLYLETLAELGLPGLLLLAGALVVPLRLAVTRRRSPGVVAACGAYVVFLAHAGVDWDWQLPAVTVPGLFAAVSILIASTSDGDVRPARRWATLVAVAAMLGVGVLAGFEVMGSRALAAAQRAASAGHWAAADRHARMAERWQPWSEEPVFIRGLAQVAAGRRSAARAAFTRAVRLNPSDWRAWYDLAGVSGRATQQHALEELELLNPAQAQRLAVARRGL